MDQDSPFSRMERNLWTFWCYVTEAVNRFLRPQPADTIDNDPNTFQESRVDSESPGCNSNTQADSGGGVVDVEQPLATLPLLSSSPPVVAWDACTTEIDLRSDEESTQLRGGNESKEFEKGESTRDEQLWQTGSDAGLLVAEEDEGEHEKTHTGNVYTCKQGQMPENGKEYVDAGLSTHIDDITSEYMKESDEKVFAEEEAQSADPLDNHEKMDETTSDVQETKDDGTKDGDELDEEVEDCEIKLCTDTNLSAEEDSTFKEKAVDHLDYHQKMDETTSDVQETKDDGTEDRDELEDHDFKMCPITDLGPEEEESMFKGKMIDPLDVHQKMDEPMTEVELIKDDGTKDGEELDEDEVAGEVKLCTTTEEHSMFKEKVVDHLDYQQKMAESKAEVQVTKDEENKDCEVKLCTMTDLGLEQEENIFKGKAVDHPNMVETTTELQVTKGDGNRDEEELEVEHHEVKLTDLGPEEDNMFKGQMFDHLDDHQKMDETTTEVQVTKDDGTKDGDELDEEEEDCEIKLCTDTNLSAEEDSTFKEKSVDHLDYHQKMDETTSDVQVTKDDGTEDRDELEDHDFIMCPITDLGPEEEESMFKGKTIDPLDVHQKMDETTTEVQVTKDDGTKDGEELDEDEEDCEIKLCTDTNLSAEEDSTFKEKAVDHLDFHQKMDETMEDQVTKSDGNKEGEELENRKEKLSTVLSSEEDSLFKEKEDDPMDDHQKTDETSTEVQVTKVGEELDEEDDCEEKLCTVTSPEGDSRLKEKAADHQKMMTDDQVTKDDVNIREDLELQDREAKLCTMTNLNSENSTDLSSVEEGEMLKEKTRVQNDDAVRLIQEEGENCKSAFNLASEDQNKSDKETEEDESQLSECEDVLEDVQEDVVGQELRGEKDQTEDVKLLVVITEDEYRNEAANEEPDIENNGRTITEGKREDDILTQNVTCGQEAMQKTFLYTNEFANKEEDVVVTDLLTAAVTEAAVADVSLNETYVDKDQVEEDRLSGEFNNKDNCVENVCTATSLTVKPDGKTEQEISGEFKNIPLWISEGHDVMSQELNTQECEERQEGVPELNNELGPNENTTQSFLKGGNCEEIQTTQLPEEVESKEQENFKNSGTGAGYLFEREQLEERQDSKEDCTNRFDFVVEHPGQLHLVQGTEEPSISALNLGSGHLFEKEEAESLESSMKTEVKHFDKDLETRIDSADEADETAEGLQNVAEFGTAGKRFLKEPVEIVPKLSDDSTVETQNVDAGEKHYADEEEEDKTHLQVAGEENGESDLSLHFQTQETKNQSPNKAAEMNEMEIKVETEAVDESKTARPKGPLVLSAEESAERVMQSEESYSGEAIRGHQDVIDEEILDLWIETAMSEDAETEQEGSEPEQQKDTTTRPVNEEPAEISSLEEKEQLMESNSVDLAFVSDTETSTSAVESGYLDQSFSETELVKSASTDSLQDIHGTLATMSESATVSEFFAPNSESQDVLLEEIAETEQSQVRVDQPVIETESYLDSGVSSPEKKCLKQESSLQLVQEEPFEESAETEAEMVAEVTARRDTEEALKSVSSLMKINAEVKGETLEVSTSGFSDEISHAGSGQWGDDSEERSVLTEPDSQSESEKLPSLDEQQRRRSEDIPETILGLNRTEVAEECTSKSEDQIEVDAPVLNFTVQRSRIAVKNPRARPPTNPRSLLNMPSAEPTPTSHVPVKVPVGVPLGGLGIGIKLPGLGAGLPVLKKTKQVVRDEDGQETHTQEPEKKAEEKSDAPKRDEAQQRPKWMPPGHPGFGNPLMSELKTKLKKTT